MSRRGERAGPPAWERRCGEEGQMVVEMAVVAPVMIVVAIVVTNLMWFLEATARFDRAVPDAVLVAAVSPSGEQGGGSGEHAVASAIEKAMGGMGNVKVSVRAETLWDAIGSSSGAVVAPHLTRYVCILEFAPWPSALTVAGVDAGIPVYLRHERSFVVDRYRAGVVF